MCYAKTAAELITAWCRATFKGDADAMGSVMADGSIIDAFDHTGYASHKYIPANRLTQDLGEPAGAGVYGYWRMKDSSCLLRTCRGDLAWWSGKAEDAAQWHGLRAEANRVP